MGYDEFRCDAREVEMSEKARVQISLRVPGDMLADFDRIATAMDRDRSWVILRAMQAYLEGDGGNILEEAEGIAELDRGEGIDIDDMLDEAEAMIRRHEAKAARKLA
jgi:predicted transcriptional regulator